MGMSSDLCTDLRRRRACHLLLHFSAVVAVFSEVSASSVAGADGVKELKDGLCSAKDLAIWKDHGLKNFMGDMDGCAFQCAARFDCVQECMEQKEQYSANC